MVDSGEPAAEGPSGDRALQSLTLRLWAATLMKSSRAWDEDDSERRGIRLFGNMDVCRCNPGRLVFV